MSTPSKNRKSSGKERAVSETPGAPVAARDPRALLRLDWIALGLIAAALFLSALLAGRFSTPTKLERIDDLFDILINIGAPLVVLLTASAYGVLAVREWRRPVAIGDVAGLARSMGLLGLWALVSLVRSQSLYLSLNALLALTTALLLGAMVARLVRDRQALLALVLTISFAGSVVACIAIHEYIVYYRAGAGIHRAFATFENPNFLAGYLLLTVPITLALFVATSDRALRLLMGICVALQTAAIWLSGSRAGGGIILVTLFVFSALAVYTRVSSPYLKRLAIGLLLFLVGSIPASPVLIARFIPRNDANSRVLSISGQTPELTKTNTQGQSSEFRKWTWIGAARVAKANPLLGVGIGTFGLAYPHYAETAYTLHAHNSYLQWMAETGYPGGLFLLTGLAAGAAFAAHALRLQRNRTTNDSTPEESYSAAEPPYHPLIAEPRILLIGLLSALIASMLHNLTDSDWYVVANVMTLAAIVALMIGLARDLAPLATLRPHPLGREMLVVGSVLTVFLVWRGGSLLVARYAAGDAQTVFETALGQSGSSSEVDAANLQRASDGLQTAAAADPFDPQPHLSLATLTQNPEERLKELQTAVRLSPSGLTYYRLGQSYVARQDWNNAIASFDHARALEPHNLQNLRALGAAYLAAGKRDQAIGTYLTITALQKTPYGTVRAVPEIVETDFAFGHNALADIYTSESRWQQAADEYAQADTVLADYWVGRNWDANLNHHTPPKRVELANLYEDVLTHWQECLNRLGQTEAAKQVATRLASVRSDRAADAAAEAKAMAGNAAAP